ncbi:SWI SNF, matrix associated, actin dependent regulator of chromatin, sub d, member 1 [Modicella reniformis]|uniref:SWI SNF, matrix associated, actin dependent regulator of chromatin, sub d, member 1 n=1 Tax=Modicella reniformis TaxID=1440133 RepID=A0A9P6SUE3_9FUNG|nr:SWI SNF, matrix associated, actin dependent regulator of chromatin, sub d, member 1 [Modicella reniformis]
MDPNRKRSSATDLPLLLAKAKRKRPNDNQISSKALSLSLLSLTDKQIEAIVPESKLYRELLDFEKKLDATIMRKRLDLQETLNKTVKIKRTLRIFISNLSHDQDVPESEDDEPQLDKGPTPSWTLKVEGRLVDEVNASAYKNKQTSRKFSSFFRSVMIDLHRDSNLYPNGNFVEWHKSPNQVDVDGFEIKRHGDENVKVSVILHVDNSPERFKLSPELADVLAIDVETRPGIMMALWQYIKFHQLQDPEDKRNINCDQKLASLFNQPKISFPALPELIGRFLSPPDPIVLEYTVRVDKPYHLSPYCYDLDVEVDDPLFKTKISSLLSSTALNSTTSSLPKQIHSQDEQIMQYIQSMHNSKTKRDFLLRFANDPADFLDRWVASQSRDLEVILGESHVNLEEQRRSEFYNQHAPAPGGGPIQGQPQPPPQGGAMPPGAHVPPPHAQQQSFQQVGMAPGGIPGGRF